ncbi:ArgS-related anticodon-binding protein NrtL [Streptomyces sp. NPDC046939]|uniref:ArgS-related anticodon-binding protein NrtL n=1 Tax=Streptomyces sp. NPDC046939 TaxID=3155376 RepID=UPI0033C140FB
MTPAEISHTVLHAVRRAVDDGELSAGALELLERALEPTPELGQDPGARTGRPRIVIERPRPGGHGDYATNVALQLAGPAGRPPRQVADILQPRLADSPGIDTVDVSGPGFLNLTLSPGAPADATRDLLLRIKRHGLAYGHGQALRGHLIDLRIPREPRAEILADAISRIGRSQGADVRVAHAADPRDVTFRPVPADPGPLGRDAGRWALLHPAPHDHPDLSENGAAHLAQRESNPLFRVRYAHARTHALTRNAADLGFASALADSSGGQGILATALADSSGRQDILAAALTRNPADLHSSAEPSSAPTNHPYLLTLLTPLTDHPRILLSAARHRAPDRLARHLVVLADAFLSDPDVYARALPLGEEKPSAAHRARLALAEAVGTVLAGGLSLLGIDAPAHL